MIIMYNRLIINDLGTFCALMFGIHLKLGVHTYSQERCVLSWQLAVLPVSMAHKLPWIDQLLPRPD